MGDDQIVISSGQVVTPETVTNRSFTSAFRGYHPAEVRQFLKQVSDEMTAGADREVELGRALQEALARAAHPELDEATLTSLLGEHAAKLLASARDTASSITAEAQERAGAVLRDAEMRVGRMREEADGLMARRVAEADASAESILRAAEAEAAARIERATQQGREMVTEARSVRERMLADLARRRRSGQVQIEQLRAVRERLVAAHEVIRRTLDEATAELDAAEPEARLAAETIARRADDDIVRRLDDDTMLGDEPPAPAAPVRREPERARSLVSAGVAPGGREGRASPAPATSLFRRVDPTPSPPERPRLRPQTVASAVAGRTSPIADAATPAPDGPPPSAAAPDDPAPDDPAPDDPAPDDPRAPAGSSPAPEVAVVDAPAAAPPVAEAPAVAPDLGPADELAAALDPSSPPAADRPPAPMSDLATSEVPVVDVDRPPADVGELFARIRADRVEPLDPTRSGPGGRASSPEPAADPVVTEHALEGRDELLDNLEAGLTRALKRVLGDEQNEVLDALRRLGPAAAGGVMPDPGVHAASYRDASVPWLQQAARAGVGFVSDQPSGSGPETAHPSIDAEAETLALELVEPLRERLSRAIEGGADADDPSVVAESLRATYRQWKVQQVEECARHRVVAAFNLGAYSATPEGAVVQWMVDDDGHCPDCDDNALAGPTVKGQPFPTGQLHPPAHPGCRCLLVPVPT